MKLIELLRVIDDSEHKNEVWIGERKKTKIKAAIITER